MAPLSTSSCFLIDATRLGGEFTRRLMAKIQRALLSVSDKTDLVPFAQTLADADVELLSTGGTARVLRDAGLTVKDISDHTGFPEMLDGRVKTMHPLVLGGLLYIRGNAEHEATVAEHGIKPIDLVVVNLYPFEATVARPDVTLPDAIENIDIGGPTMLRSAAKNHDSVTVITDPADYAAAAQLPAGLNLNSPQTQTLRYGENPFQKAALYGNFKNYFEQLHGKALSYNNILDLTAAANLIGEFSGEAPTLAILKHTNPCGVGQGDSLKDAWDHAFATDNQAPFGGIIAVNRPLDGACAESIAEIFSEVIVAPEFTPEALEVLQKKKNLRLIKVLKDLSEAPAWDIRSVGAESFLVQESDRKQTTVDDLKVVTKRQPTEEELSSMLFGWKIVKHIKSNAILYVGPGRTIGVGAGQMSRVDSSRIAVWKAGGAGLALQGSVVCSDAFFPFADGLIAAAEAGATAAIQPGGSMRDPEVIAAADERDMAMAFAGDRHFRH